MDPVLNFVQLTPDIGTSGQPTADQFAGIAEQGYRAVINLAMPDSDGALPDEGGIVSGLGMCYVHIPVPFDAPTARHLQQFIGALKAFEGDRVWVHCAVNARVSAFMYHYLTAVRGVPGPAARSPILARWEPDMDATWRDFLALPASAFLSPATAGPGSDNGRPDR